MELVLEGSTKVEDPINKVNLALDLIKLRFITSLLTMDIFLRLKPAVIKGSINLKLGKGFINIKLDKVPDIRA